MCDYEDWPLISKYTKEDAVKDGILSELLRWNDFPVMVTTSVRDDFRYVDLLNVWHQFLAWQDTEGRKPQKEDKIFTAVLNGKKIWVMEDIDSFTILYPSDY